MNSFNIIIVNIIILLLLLLSRYIIKVENIIIRNTATELSLVFTQISIALLMKAALKLKKKKEKSVKLFIL